MTRFIFAEIRDKEVRAYMRRLRARIPIQLDKNGRLLAERTKAEAQSLIRTAIPNNHRTGELESSFIIEERSRNTGCSYEIKNFAPYSNFIDQSDITATEHKQRDLSIHQIKRFPGLTQWFMTKSDFYKEKRRLPWNTRIGRPGPGRTYHNRSLFSKYPTGVQFMYRSFRNIIEQSKDKIERDLITDLKL